ncbi:MAG: GNAT family N-acetyltransferase [Candidatus Eremiobacteraeota bacterium]|nr:GNAT family N-acetyltransferase [Candidatus Eremiobacteraeota bacterium]MBV8331749.1 GNAT family N-acetyltransferase [Candidatus Eremiobacteraeota bacterium]
MDVTAEENATLTGTHVRLEPLHERHAEGLARAVTLDPSLYRWSLVPRDEAAMRAYVETALRWKAEGNAVPFAIVRRSDGVPIGSTRFFDIERWPWPDDYDNSGRPFDACEIGYTWLAADAIRTAVNTEAKLLLLTHAFETWNLWRVCFHTDERNERSRAALAGIGATFEGIMRAYRVASDVTPRNSARFSILAAEWPAVKQHLENRLARRPASTPLPQSRSLA